MLLAKVAAGTEAMNRHALAGACVNPADQDFVRDQRLQRALAPHKKLLAAHHIERCLDGVSKTHAVVFVEPEWLIHVWMTLSTVTGSQQHAHDP